MIKRRARGRRNLREELLATATDLFYRDGIRAVGVDTIISKSGVAKMTLYKHFKSKDELVTAAVRRYHEDFKKYFADGLAAQGGPARERLLGVFDLVIDAQTQRAFRGCPFINVVSELADREHPARQVVREHKAAMRTMMSALAAEAGAAEPALLADQLMMLIEGGIVAMQREGNAEPLRQAKQAAAVLLGA